MITGTRIDKATGKITRQRRHSSSSPNKQRRQQTQRASREPVGASLARRIEGLIGLKSGKGCGCQTLAAKMDAWGIAGCQRHRGEIVAALVANRDVLVSAMQQHGGLGLAAGLVVGILPDSVLTVGADWLLTEAINETRAQQPARQAKPRGQRGDRTRRVNQKPHFAGPFVPNPEWTSTVRHLTYHVWPTKQHDGWRWNVQQLASRSSMFNGSRILGVVVSRETESAATVIDYAASLGISFHHVVERPNDKKLREVVTWLPMIELLNPETAGQNEVVFSAHAKGVRHSDPLNDAGTLKRWTETMYRICLDDWPAVEHQINRYIATGCFKRYNNFKTPGNFQWHYSGTFMWWRLAEIGRRNWRKVDQHFYGTESWLGHQCHESETGCLFLDDCGDLYQPQYWRGVVQPAWEARVKR